MGRGKRGEVGGGTKGKRSGRGEEEEEEERG